MAGLCLCTVYAEHNAEKSHGMRTSCSHGVSKWGTTMQTGASVVVRQFELYQNAYKGACLARQAYRT